MLRLVSSSSMLACCAIYGDGLRIASSTSKKGAAGNEAEAARLAAEPLAAGRSKPLELEAHRKFEQELASVRDAIRHGPNPYGTKAWRAVHQVNIGVECQGSGLQIVEGGSTIVSVYKKSPVACLSFCKETEGCVAWSWNKEDVDKNCYAQHSCARRVPKSNMVSGMKASFDGDWYYTIASHLQDFRFDETHWFTITVDKTGEMTFEDSDGEHGKLRMVGGSTLDRHMASVGWVFEHDGLLRNEELEAKLEDSRWKDAKTVRLRLRDGKIQLSAWLAVDKYFTEFTAEQKDMLFLPYDRVTVKHDQVIVASDVRLRPAGNSTEIPFILEKGDIGTVDHVCYPRKIGVIFDHDPGKTVWVKDTLLAKSAILKEVSEDELRDVLGNLADVLIHAIQDPITLSIFKDPVMASDGYTYERSAMERLILRAEGSNETLKSPMSNEPLSSVKLSSNYAIRSLVSSVIEINDAARAAAGKIQKHFRGYRARKAVLGCGNVPVIHWKTS